MRRGAIKRRANVGIDLIAFGQVADGCADAEVFGTLLGAKSVVLRRVEIVRVRVERAQHRRHGGLEDGVVVQLLPFDIVILYDGQSLCDITLDGGDGGYTAGARSAARGHAVGRAAPRRLSGA